MPLAALGVSLLGLRAFFHRVEHVLLALTGDSSLSSSRALTRDAALIAVATLGTTLAPC